MNSNSYIDILCYVCIAFLVDYILNDLSLNIYSSITALAISSIETAYCKGGSGYGAMKSGKYSSGHLLLFHKVKMRKIVINEISFRMSHKHICVSIYHIWCALFVYQYRDKNISSFIKDVFICVSIMSESFLDLGQK